MSDLYLTKGRTGTVKSDEEAAAYAAKRREVTKQSAINAARKQRVLSVLCEVWLRENNRAVYDELRLKAGINKPYNPRPDMKGKSHFRSPKAAEVERFYGTSKR